VCPQLTEPSLAALLRLAIGPPLPISRVRRRQNFTQVACYPQSLAAAAKSLVQPGVRGPRSFQLRARPPHDCHEAGHDKLSLAQCTAMKAACLAECPERDAGETGGSGGTGNDAASDAGEDSSGDAAGNSGSGASAARAGLRASSSDRSATVSAEHSPSTVTISDTTKMNRRVKPSLRRV
jgi:hypothetical protein